MPRGAAPSFVPGVGRGVARRTDRMWHAQCRAPAGRGRYLPAGVAAGGSGGAAALIIVAMRVNQADSRS